MERNIIVLTVSELSILVFRNDIIYYFTSAGGTQIDPSEQFIYTLYYTYSDIISCLCEQVVVLTVPVSGNPKCVVHSNYS